MYKTTRFNTAQVGEFRVAAELARSGFTVALPTGNAPDIDVLAYRGDQYLAVQVKAASQAGFQFVLDRFLSIECTEDGGQRVIGPKPGLDEGICMALVSVGQEPNQDSILWTSMKSFAELLAEHHRAYLDKNGGRRPGPNPKSMHAALTRKQFEAAIPCSTVTEFLANHQA